jgi:hypothetical protein
MNLAQRNKRRIIHSCEGNQSILYLSGGMPRSGSTWLFNAIRLILLSSSDIEKEYSGGWIGDSLDFKRYVLIKIHGYDSDLISHAKFVAYSYRDVRDAIASNFRKFNLEPTLKTASKWINAQEKWIGKSDVVVRYEDMIVDKLPIVNRLASKLNAVDIDANVIVKQLESLSYHSGGGKSKICPHNKLNLYHKGHITDGRHGSWRETLAPALVKTIEDKHRLWFEKNNYSV